MKIGKNNTYSHFKNGARNMPVQARMAATVMLIT